MLVNCYCMLHISVTVGNMATALYDFDGQEGELSFKVRFC